MCGRGGREEKENLEWGDDNRKHEDREGWRAAVLYFPCWCVFPPGMRASSTAGCGGVEESRRAGMDGGVAVPHGHTTLRGGSREQSTYSHSHRHNNHFTSNDYGQHTH